MTSKMDKRNAEAVATILEHLENMAATGGEHEKQIEQYLRLFKIPAPTEKDKKRPVLAKYVNQYTARNTMDYFIHKDLGGFLRRELDFYIKNEVMRLMKADAPAVKLSGDNQGATQNRRQADRLSRPA
jgi:adenine-specific DNA-methyltransferase